MNTWHKSFQSGIMFGSHLACAIKCELLLNKAHNKFATTVKTHSHNVATAKVSAATNFMPVPPLNYCASIMYGTLHTAVVYCLTLSSGKIQCRGSMK